MLPGLLLTAENKNLWEEMEEGLVLKQGSGFRVAKQVNQTPMSLQPERMQNWV